MIKHVKKKAHVSKLTSKRNANYEKTFPENLLKFYSSYYKIWVFNKYLHSNPQILE